MAFAQSRSNDKPVRAHELEGYWKRFVAGGKLRVFRLPSSLLLNDDLITIAGSRFQLGFVQNGYVASRVGNHPSLLQDAGGDADGGSTGSEHLGEELLGQRKRRAANPLVAHQ